MSRFLGRKRLLGLDAPKAYKHLRFQRRPLLAAKTAYYQFIETRKCVGLLQFQTSIHIFDSDEVILHNVTRLAIDLLAIQEKSLDRALFLYIFIREVRSSGVRASITIVHIRKFYKM